MAAIIFCEAYLFMRVWFSKTSLMLLQKKSLPGILLGRDLSF